MSRIFTSTTDEEAHQEEQQITVTSPMAKDVIITQQYVCQIHSRRHIDVCALEDGYLNAIHVKEGQAVKEGDVMFEIMPVLYKAKWDAEVAERDLAKLELDYSQDVGQQKRCLSEGGETVQGQTGKGPGQGGSGGGRIQLYQGQSTVSTASSTACRDLQGSLVKEGDILTTLSDNSVMWVYFNVPEKPYLEYMAHRKEHEEEDRSRTRAGEPRQVPAARPIKR